MFLRTMGVDDNSLNLKRWEYLIIKRAFLPNGVNNRIGEEVFLYSYIRISMHYTALISIIFNSNVGYNWHNFPLN